HKTLEQGLALLDGGTHELCRDALSAEESQVAKPARERVVALLSTPFCVSRVPRAADAVDERTSSLRCDPVAGKLDLSEDWLVSAGDLGLGRGAVPNPDPEDVWVDRQIPRRVPD